MFVAIPWKNGKRREAMWIEWQKHQHNVKNKNKNEKEKEKKRKKEHMNDDGKEI